MCVWDEELMIELAIESSKDFVNRYIIIDKNGKTLPIIEELADKWNLNIETHVKPALNLSESRIFAIKRVDEPWILIQDGDEVFHTDGLTAIHNLRHYMNRLDVFFCSRMTVLKGDLGYTRLNNQIQPHHKFLYHNNGTISIPTRGDLPDSRAFRVDLPGIWKFNCIVKSPKRMFLRLFWNEWSKYSYRKYPEIEDFVSKEYGIDVEENARKYFHEMISELIPYNENRFGPYPQVIRRIINQSARARILDIGCGARPIGDVNIDLYFGESPHTQYKIVPQEIRNFIIGDACNLPIRDNSFLYGNASHLLEHLLKPTDCIQEVQRISKKGARFKVPNNPNISEYHEHLYSWSLSSFRYLLEQFFPKVKVTTNTNLEGLKTRKIYKALTKFFPFKRGLERFLSKALAIELLAECELSYSIPSTPKEVQN